MQKFFLLITMAGLLLTVNAHSSIDDQHLETEKYQISLQNLNPLIGSWYFLSIQELEKNKRRFNFHIEIPSDSNMTLGLHKIGFQLGDALCPLWDNSSFNLLTVDLAKHTDPFYPLCDDAVFVRLAKPSNTKISSTESISRLLRRNLSSGERVINLVKPYLVSRSAENGGNFYQSAAIASRAARGPAAALVSYSTDRVPFATKHQIGINLRHPTDKLAYGQWYETKMQEGIYVSLMMPEWVSSEIKASFPDRVNPLSNSESDKMVYMIAYDLDKYQAEYVAGLEQPGIRQPSALHKHLVPVGNVPSYRRQNTVGVFIGGFQQRHGRINRGPHQGKVYGYTQNGVPMEPLSPGLATFIATTSTTDIISWPATGTLQHQVVSARQNGVPLIENGEPHPLVSNWGWGNWSGDSQGRLQSLRSAICIQQHQDKRYLVFAAFTSATPSSMAKVLQSYQCQSAMHLDMNAYMYVHNALIDYKQADKVEVEYLHQEMEYPKGVQRHRYILDNNARDFFYVYRKAN